MSDMTIVNLRNLDYAPDMNPFISPSTVPLKKKLVSSGLASKTLVDVDTGEINAVSIIRQIEEKDTDEFVKVFSSGIAAAYELTRTGQRVFQAVLQEYERTPMRKGFADSVYLAWFDDGLSGRDIGMSDKTFQRGLKELLIKKFLAPKSPNLFWVNPSLFFKGDRVMFVKEFKRKKSSIDNKAKVTQNKSIESNDNGKKQKVS